MFYRRQVCLFKDVCQLYYKTARVGGGGRSPNGSLVLLSLSDSYRSRIGGGKGGVFVEFYGVFFLFKLGIYTHLTFNQYISI